MTHTFASDSPPRSFNSAYEGPFLSRIAYPLGGIGAGMFCVEGNGAFSNVSLRHKPDLFNAPMLFAAVKFPDMDGPARVLEGPLQDWKIQGHREAGLGIATPTSGFPRLQQARFKAGFPFAEVDMPDSSLPLQCSLTAWSPFLPGNADDSSLPVAVLEYTFSNPSAETICGVFSYHAENFMRTGDIKTGTRVEASDSGFVLHQSGAKDAPWDEGSFAVNLLEDGARSDCAWFRGGWFDAPTMLWKRIDSGKAVARAPYAEGRPSPGGSVYLPFEVNAGESRRITVLLTWYVPLSNECHDVVAGNIINTPPAGHEGPYVHAPWYAGRFGSVTEVTAYARQNLTEWRKQSACFRDCLKASTLPPEVLEAVEANLSILKSPTVMRQRDGRLWGWEGCKEYEGSCLGTCTHVWNYAQALPHLFPDLERSLRATEFVENQRKDGHQTFRSTLPVSFANCPNAYSAADGQLGGIMKIYRDWRISGNLDWLREFWPRITASLDYCIRTWDPKETGVLTEPHHNTYDIEFWGPNGMCMSFYLGALRAALLMAEALGEAHSRYDTLYRKGREFSETQLYNGDYFIQTIEWDASRAGDPGKTEGLVNPAEWSPEAQELLEREGPKYQYGSGCLSDGVLGAWMAEVCGIGEILDPVKVRSHLLAVHRYNLKHDLSLHANPQRPGYALGNEGGLLLCSWPHGGAPSLPFVYSNEVWTGIEYQVASHLMMMGCVEEGLEIVRLTRSRYDGRIRNPFDEYECGHWYARALASYGLLQGLSGIRYDAVTQTLHIEPAIRGDFSSFLCTETGYGLAGVQNGRPFIDIYHGEIVVRDTVYTPALHR